MSDIQIAKFADLKDREPAGTIVANVDLVIVRYDDKVSVLYGRCLHRGALLEDGFVDGDNLMCGVHKWDFRIDSGISSYDNSEALHKFSAKIKDGYVVVDEEEISAWEEENPQPYNRDSYLGRYADTSGGAPEEPFNETIQNLANNGLSETGSHGPMAAMGVSIMELPKWDDIQFVTAQLAQAPLLGDGDVNTKVIIGPNAKKPLTLDIPIFVSDMSFGSLSTTAKVALAMGAEMAGTGICSGEGGMLPEEQEACSRYFYELASGKFGFSMEKVKKAQAFHFKGGQAAKTGTGGHLPASKVTKKIAEVRDIDENEDAISPARFPDMTEIEDFRSMAEKVREATGGIPIGFKLSAQHIEDDIDAAVAIGVDYIILDGRGGGTGAAPLIFRDNISVPTIPALARARHHLDKLGRQDVSLIITGGLRTPADYAKALALGADAIAVANSALQAIGCLAMRACHTNNCPVGIASQKEHLVSRLIAEKSAENLERFLKSSVSLMQILARACGHHSLNDFCQADLITWDEKMTRLSGVKFGGLNGQL